MSANKFTLDGLESFELEQKGRFSCCFSYRALVLEATALTTEPQPLPTPPPVSSRQPWAR